MHSSPPDVDKDARPSEPPTPLERGSGTVPVAAASPQGSEAVQGVLQARESLSTLIQISPDLVVLHRSGRIVCANPAVARALGIPSSDELIGTSLIDLFHPDDQA